MRSSLTVFGSYDRSGMHFVACINFAVMPKAADDVQGFCGGEGKGTSC